MVVLEGNLQSAKRDLSPYIANISGILIALARC